MKSLPSGFGVIAVLSLDKFVDHRSVIPPLLQTDSLKSWILQNQTNGATALANVTQRTRALVAWEQVQSLLTAAG